MDSSGPLRRRHSPRGVYDRDAHVRLIHDSVIDFFETRRLNAQDPSVEVSRGHFMLKGKPAGAKTTLFERFKAWYEQASQVMKEG